MCSSCYRFDDAKFGIFIHWSDELHAVALTLPSVRKQEPLLTALLRLRGALCRGVYSVPSWATVGEYAEWYWNRLVTEPDGGLTAAFHNGPHSRHASARSE